MFSNCEKLGTRACDTGPRNAIETAKLYTRQVSPRRYARTLLQDPPSKFWRAPSRHLLNNMMNIAYVCVQDANDPEAWSGLPFRILKAMQKRGHAVHLISPLTRRFRYRYAVEKLFWNKDLQIDREPLALANYASQIMKALKNTDANVVFAPSSIPVSYLECSQPIVWWTDAVYESMINYYPGFSQRNLRRAHDQERRAMEGASKVFYSSEWAADAARSYYPEMSAKIGVVPFGANVPERFVVPPQARRVGPPYKLLFMGVDWERKGGLIAVETVRLLNQQGFSAILQIVGCAPPLEKFPYVRQFGFISKRTPEGRKRICELFKSSDLLFLPTRAEAAGVVFCEACAFGKPVVTTRTGGVETYVKHALNGLTLPLEAGPEEYASAIRGIFEKPGEYLTLSNSAYREYQERLNWSTAVETVLSALDQTAT